MKTAIIALSLILGASTAQKRNLCENNYILFCGSSEASVSKSSLEDCASVSVAKNDLEVTSFIVSWKASPGVLVEEKVMGNQLSEKTIESIQKIDVGSKVYIEKVTMSDGEEIGCKILQLTK